MLTKNSAEAYLFQTWDVASHAAETHGGEVQIVTFGDGRKVYVVIVGTPDGVLYLA